ncbi:MAG: prepilin-type N-terminal cleavage/methylation domain-containing protein [Alteromonadaceae bacterium]|nr:prepilin-type N-terminal cleavage/methylation domain-containing protein [Alteromonadaceae bacterium]
MTYPYKNAGFTLIELLVVLSISMFMISLIGGLTVDSLKKNRAKAEIMELEDVVLKATMESFLYERALLLIVEDQELQLKSRDNLIYSKRFEYLSFESNVVEFNKWGLPTKPSLFIEVFGRKRRIQLSSSSENA